MVWNAALFGRVLLTRHCFSLCYTLSELGTSLFEIAQSLFAFERTLILGAMALSKNKSEEQPAN